MAGFESFVAWRYLLTREREVSKLAATLLLIGAALYGVAIGLHKLLFLEGNPLGLSLATAVRLGQVLTLASYVVAAIAALSLFFGLLRLRFTFFTVVPLGGVWIGTGALVCVLSVMSGFESDLRNKIVGSNAHVQVTREDGDFVEWREVKAAIDALPGVRGSTPFASSEVVIAANNNGMNVVIKGIDPNTIGSVTDLVRNLEDPAALERLAPLVVDELEAPPAPARPPATMDPPPPDLLEGGDPIDFSAPGSAPAPAGSEPAASASDEPFGGDALAVVDLEPPAASAPRDPPPADFDVPDEPPIDFSETSAGTGSSGGTARAGQDGERDSTIDHELDDELGGHVRVIEAPPSPRSSRRTLSLPGVLVGRELVKQTHMYTGQEVRVVSPLSDPSNPDATGTPIPFNRDYRVAGVFFTGMYEYDLKQVYVTLESFQEFLDRGDAVDGIEVRIDRPDDAAAYVRRVSQAIGPQYRVVDWTELNRSLFSALKLEKIAMFIVLGIVILVASFSIVGNLIMVVFEKGREIALLKTLGATDWAVMRLFVLRGVMIGLIGTVLGVGMGLTACVVAKRLGIPLDPDVYYIDKLPIHIDGSSVVIISVAGVLISGLAALYPALLAIRIRPATGLRH